MNEGATTGDIPEKVWSVEIDLVATLYVRGADAEQAAERARRFVDGATLEVSGPDVYAGTYAPGMPEASLSPAMTIDGRQRADQAGTEIVASDMEMVAELTPQAAGTAACADGIHSWAAETRRLAADETCADCGEPYGEPA